MRSKRLWVFFFALLVSFIPPTVRCQSKPSSRPNPIVARVGDTAFLQLRSESFTQLDARQQALAYWLSEAAIAIDPIIYDQLSRYGLRQKRVLEEIVAHPGATEPGTLGKVRDFTLLFWGNRGNHNDVTAQKFLPSFSFDELKDAALKAQAAGAFKTASADLPAITKPEALVRELDDLRASLFDPNFEPTITTKSPPSGQDILQASSNNFYWGVTLADLKNFHESYPLNSRVVKSQNGSLEEQVYRAGTPEGKVPPGLYATFLKKANECLEKARTFADPKQAKVIADLIHYYQTGDYKDWLQFGTDWVQDDTPVDFANGFIEVYRDARGAKGSSQAFVTVTDQPVTTTMIKLARNANYFERKAPWDAKYKRTEFQMPVVKAVDVLIETGDFNVTTIGDNLPNENEIHEKYGTKNFLFLGASHAFTDAVGVTSVKEFAATPEEVERARKYGDEAEDLLTAMHEVIGHGSGKLSDKVKGGAAEALKEYFSTLEEARADLVAYWNVWDPKLKELGLVTDQDAIGKTMYDSAARVALTQLRSNPKGDTIEEDHQRDRQLIANYIMDKTGSIERMTRDGKAYMHVKDYQKMHDGVGMLLAELMRIKAEGDYEAIKALVDKYGVHFDPALRDQVVSRYKALNLPTYWAGVNPQLTPEPGGQNSIRRVQISNVGDPVAQYLRYASMYDPGLAGEPKAAKPKVKKPKSERQVVAINAYR